MGDRDKLICPLMETVRQESEFLAYCMKADCAWWDSHGDMCCILTLARWVAAIPSYLGGEDGGG